LALFALPRVNFGENSGGLHSNRAANQDSQDSQRAESSSVAGDKSLTNLSTIADTKRLASSPTQQTLDNEASTFVAISHAFPSQSQDDDATLVWMTRTEPHDSGAVTGHDNQMEFSAVDPYDEIRQIDEQLSNISAKVADISNHFEPMAKYAFHASQELGEAIEEVVVRLKACGSRSASISTSMMTRALDGCVFVMGELQALVIDFGKGVSPGRTKRTSEDIMGKIRDAQEMLAIALRSNAARLLADEEANLPRDKFDETSTPNEDLVSSLGYPGMFDRQQSIQPPCADDFEWLYLYDPFVKFLRGDQSPFWISGKAGSGKSTIMRMIETDQRTQEALLVWANGRTQQVLSYYFDHTENPLQSSLEGLLRSLLYQLLQEKPVGTHPTVVAMLGHCEEWDAKDLLLAFDEIIRESESQCFFLVIDGLDECHGEMNVLLDIILDLHMLNTVKMCVASRPYNVFRNRLGRSQHLELTEVIAEGISIFVRGKLSLRASAMSKDLAGTIIERSEGSYLKAALLVDEVESMLAQGADEEAMERRINEMNTTTRNDTEETLTREKTVATNTDITASATDTTTHTAMNSSHERQETTRKRTEEPQSGRDYDMANLEGPPDGIVSGNEITVERKNLMSRLWYPGMFDRKCSIRPPFADTFGWIYHDSRPPEADEVDFWEFDGQFARFLSGDRSSFCIPGERQCGKSTMMSMIEYDQRTKAALSTWAKGRPLHIVSFYFHGRGSALQRSIDGLLRSILYQLAKAMPVVGDIVGLTDTKWDTQELLSNLLRVLSAFPNEYVFMLVDALDECEESDVHENHEFLNLVRSIQQLSNVKICFSCRPLVDQTVSRMDALILDTTKDIETFVRTKLAPWVSHSVIDFASILAQKAHGNFLQAALLVDVLEEGLQVGDDDKTLMLRLLEDRPRLLSKTHRGILRLRLAEARQRLASRGHNET
jgi:hypothetical protein